MRYWWVNQNQTFRQERAGGYLWSPKRNADGGRNPFYEFMREVAPGDHVLSFEGTFIRAIGVIQSYCYECPKPTEFGAAGPNWENIGWKVDVHYRDLIHQIRPADHMAAIQPRLPARYAPLQASGRNRPLIPLMTHAGLAVVCRGGRSQHEQKTRYAQSGTSSAHAPGARARRTGTKAGLNFLSFKACRCS